MALSNGDIVKAWKGWLKAVLRDPGPDPQTDPGRPCQWNKAELTSVIQVVDQWADDNAASFNAALPAFIRTGDRGADTDEKAALLAAVLIMRMTPEFRRDLLVEISRG